MFIISYKSDSNIHRTLMNYALFGRIVYKKYKDRKYAYYEPGMLDEKQFARIMASIIAVKSIEGLDFDVLNMYGTLEVKEEERDESTMFFETGKEHWEKIAKERACDITIKRKKKVIRTNGK